MALLSGETWRVASSCTCSVVGWLALARHGVVQSSDGDLAVQFCQLNRRVAVHAPVVVCEGYIA